MKRILAAGAVLGTAFGSVVGAQAADMAVKAPYTKAPALAAVYDWTGFYIGVNGGYGLGRNRTTNVVPGNSSNVFFQQPDGATGGGQIGYNWQTNGGFLGPILFGVEADIQGANLRDNRTTLNGTLGIVSNYDQRIDWFGTVRGRIGLVTGSTVGYVTGGYAYGDVRSSVTHTLGATSGTFTSNNSRGGYVIGSGVEAAIGGNWTGKVEYLYMDLGNRTDTFTLLAPQTMETRVRQSIFRAGLNYRIGGGYLNPVVANWNGFYLGGNVGSGLARDRASLATPFLTERYNLAPDGYNGGGQIGYNWQAGSLVFGLEADVQGNWQRDRDTCILTCTAGLSQTYDAKLGWFATARSRLGYAVGTTLFYATGGYAVGEARTRITTAATGALTTTTQINNTKSGYAVGGGIETPFVFLGLFGPNWTTKTEYLYVDLGSTSTPFLANGVPFNFTQRVNEHVFRTGINYQFNKPVVARF